MPYPLEIAPTGDELIDDRSATMTATWPVTPGQRRLLNRLVDGGSPAKQSLDSRIYSVFGPLDLDALAAACERVAARHPALGGRFEWRAGEWCFVPDPVPTGVLFVGPHARSVPAARGLAPTVERDTYQPVGSAFFQVAVSQHPDGTAAVMFTGDRVTVDPLSLSTLAQEVSSAYAAAVAGDARDGGVDGRWLDHLASLPAPAAGPMPPWWRDVKSHLAANGGHPVAHLPVATRIEPGAAPERDIEGSDIAMPLLRQVADAAHVERLTVLLAALGEPIAQLGGSPAYFQVPLDDRGPGGEGAIGAWTVTTLVAVPQRSAPTWAAHLARIDELLAQARSPEGLAWADEALGDEAAPTPGHPTISLAPHTPETPLGLAGTSKEVPLFRGSGVVAAGQLTYEAHEHFVTLFREQDRFDPGLVAALTGAPTSVIDAMAKELLR